MRGNVKIKKVNHLTGEEEIIFEEQNQLTEGLKHAIVNLLTGTGSKDARDYKLRYCQLGDQKYDLSTYDISGDLTSSAFKSYFWTIKSPLTLDQYGRDSKFGVTNEKAYILGSTYASGQGTTKVIDNFVQPPDSRTVNNEYSNQIALQRDGQVAPYLAPSSTWISGCTDTWSLEPSNIAVHPLSAYPDYTMSGPDFKTPTWRISYTPNRYLVNDDGDASFINSCIRPNFSYIYEGNTANHLKGEEMVHFTKLQENQTHSAYMAGVHYVSGVGPGPIGSNTVSSTPLVGRVQIFNRFAQVLVSTQAGQNRHDFLYRYDYENPEATYTPCSLEISSGWQRNEEEKGDSIAQFSSVYDLSSESEYGIVSGNIYNRYGPVYTYADHLVGYTTANGAGAAYLDTSNVGFGPSGNFYRASITWANAPNKMINYYKGYGSGSQLEGQGILPYTVPIVSSVFGADITLQADGVTPSGHSWPETTPRAQAYVSFVQWDFSPSAGPVQNVHAEQSHYLTYPQYFVDVPSYNTTKLVDNTANIRVDIDRNLANSQTIREVGLFIKNPSGALVKDVPFLAAYKLLPCDINKTSEFSYIVDWELSFTDNSVTRTEQAVSSDGCTSS